MTVLHLLTHDKELAKLCREIVISHLSESVEFAEGGASISNQASLYFIDISSDDFGRSELLHYDPASTVLFVGRQDLPKYADILSQIRCCVVIKPASAMRVEMIIRQCLERKCARRADDDVADVDALLKSVLNSNLHLQIYDQDRNHFLLRAMHDFRTPLTSLEGYSGLLLNQQLGALSHPQAVVLERMQQSIRRLTYLADGIFHMSLGRNALQPLELEPEDIESCINQAIHEITGALEDKSLKVDLDISPPGRALSFERVQIERVLVNLLDNASKFSPRSASISVRAYPYFWDRRKEQIPLTDGVLNRRQTDRYGTNSFRIDVTDLGPAISEDFLLHIFEQHLSILARDDRSGTGLGLSICKLILERHRGVIWAKSTNVGAVFSMVLPYHSGLEIATHCESNKVRKASERPVRMNLVA